MKFIEIPNLPSDEVKKVIVAGNISKESEFSLKCFGIDIIKTIPNNALYDAVKYHPDMIIHHLGGNNFICDENMYKYFISQAPFLNICSGYKCQKKYPYDIAYNAARVGNFLAANLKYTERNLIEYMEKHDIKLINVKQGYAKCSTCIISKNAVITSDITIANALKTIGIDVLFIDDSGVKLKGLSNGFFGGATGKISPDKLAVNGNIKYHKNCDEIIKFANKYNIEIISLNNYEIEDIGSILPICQK